MLALEMGLELLLRLRLELRLVRLIYVGRLSFDSSSLGNIVSVCSGGSSGSGGNIVFLSCMYSSYDCVLRVIIRVKFQSTVV